MKTLWKSLLCVALGAFTFAACDDVPEPYPTPGQGTNGGGTITEPADPTGTGTLADPYNVAAAIKYIEDGNSETVDVYVKGIVVSVDQGSYDPSYGSLKYYISDDGSKNNQFRVYNGYAGPNRTKFNSESDLKAGDVVVICGKLVLYSGTKEFTTGNYVVSINGGEGGETPDTPNTPAEGEYINETFSSSFGVFSAQTVKGTPWTLDSYGYAKATGYDNASKTTTPSESYLVSNPVDLTAAQKATVTFDYILRYVTTSTGEPVDGIENKVLVTDNYTGDPATTAWTDITGTLTEVRDWNSWQKFSAAVPEAIQGKDKVVFALYYQCDASSGTWEVKNFAVKEYKENEGGENTPGGGEVSENSITVSGAALGYTEDTEIDQQTITLEDGTTLYFSKNDGKTAPKYYKNGANFRMYPSNTLKITGSKKIASVIINCGSNQGTICNASGDVASTPGSVNTNDAVITVSDVDNTEVTISNTSTTTGAASQIRMTSFTINYAE